MKYLGLLVALVIIYFILTRGTPIAEVKDAIVQGEAAPLTTGGREPAQTAGATLRRPLDRTHEVLENVKARNGDGEF